MKVIEFLKNAPSITDGLASLHLELGIKAKIYEDEGLIVLNYSQIDSPKTHPIVQECRGLIIDNDLTVVARPFDRFFNYGEALNVMPEIDWENASIFEKVDGSLIKIYFHKGRWEVATRGTAFAESECMGHGITFKELVFNALKVHDDDGFQYLMNNAYLFRDTTYLFELTCVENRVVRHYHGYNLHFLAARDNVSGNYSEECRDWLRSPDCILYGIVKHPKRYALGSADEALQAAKELKNLDEGFIVYQNAVPIAKIKSPAYVAVHHIRGEGLNPKRIMELVLSGEHDEYLSYFPEDRPIIQPYVDSLLDMLNIIAVTYPRLNQATTPKAFAAAIKHAGIDKQKASVYFMARRDNKDPVQVFHGMKTTFKMDMLRKWMMV
ncbi:RNA ligase [Pseudomonas phage phiPMW]|uniref:RNA ligase n=1 Tax=Pseudomonas phage phiPMW TaxID=1815582 RepID=A0A1S5R1G0_9CAUD|nr:RNA ligase and tail fiber protein attachment catalyst [Pseudomonas phage phiPMW]ANA49236.1 RNA ligase [Pseudomonas phage phiPMW]